MAASSKNSFDNEMRKEREEFNRTARGARKDLMVRVEIYQCDHPSTPIFSLNKGARLERGLDMVGHFIDKKLNMAFPPINKKDKKR